MNEAELKLKIFRQVDSLEKTRLEDFYGLLLNYVNGQNELNDWIQLTDQQKKGITDAIDEVDSGQGFSHDVVINKFRKKYSND
jgi:hypothetical protein